VNQALAARTRRGHLVPDRPPPTVKAVINIGMNNHTYIFSAAE
jgi:hypothetical protein